MLNQTVTVFLNTPLIQTEGAAAPDTLKIKGKIVAESAQGFLINVEAFGNDRSWHEDSPWVSKIFLPIHKVDFIAMK